MQQLVQVKTRGQSTIELALALPLLLLLLLGGIGIGLSILATSQMQTAAFHGALVAARTDPGGQTASGGTNCPSVVTNAAQTAVDQSLNLNGTSGSTQYIYGVIPVKSIVVTVACQNNFDRSSTSATQGTGSLNLVTVNVNGVISFGFLPFSPSLSVNEQQTTAVEPYRSRS